MPEISQYINNYFNPDVVTPDTPSDNKNNTTDDDNKTTIKEYVISDKPEIIFEKFKINNIVVYAINDNPYIYNEVIIIIIILLIYMIKIKNFCKD